MPLGRIRAAEGHRRSDLWLARNGPEPAIGPDAADAEDEDDEAVELLLRISEIDGRRMVIRVEQGTGREDRSGMIPNPGLFRVRIFMLRQA